MCYASAKVLHQRDIWQKLMLKCEIQTCLCPLCVDTNDKVVFNKIKCIVALQQMSYYPECNTVFVQ